jgi:recombination protein RecA
MAKTTTKTEEKKGLLEIAAELNKKYSGNKQEQFDLSTGSLRLDRALGGGMRSGRITELISWEGAGKTTVCLHLVAEAHKRGIEAAYVDAEHALDEKYARAIGADWDRLKPLLFQPDYGEAAFEYGQRLMETGKLGLLIFDSTSGMIPKSQMDAEPGASHIGKHALLFSKEIPKINVLAARNNVIVVFVSQFREKVGVMFGSPETTQAGNALKFFASNRIELRRTLTKEEGSVTGQITRFKVLKCKTAAPFGTGEFQVNFGEGIKRDVEIVEDAVEAGIINKSGSWYSYEDTVLQLLRDNPELLQEIETKLLTSNQDSNHADNQDRGQEPDHLLEPGQ